MNSVIRTRTILNIKSCTDCHLYKIGHGPIPFSGPTPARVAVLGEAPGKQEDLNGEPFIGPAGELLRDLCDKAELDIKSYFIYNSVSCYPSGTPKPASIKACSRVRELQLSLANPEWILSLGGVALSTFRPDLKITRSAGHVFFVGERKIFCTFHPAAAMRHMGTERKMLADLVIFKRLLDGEPLTVVSVDCVICGVDVEDMDAHGLWLQIDQTGGTYCNDCWAKRSKT